MAISTYSELQTAVASWLRRSNDAVLVAQVPDFITLAESRLNRLLRLRVMETETALTATQGSRYVALPSGFIDPVALWYTGVDPRRTLVQKMPADIPVSTTSGTPEYWAIDGANIALERPASSAFGLLLRHLTSFALSDGAPTNWLLTNHPDLYLYGALIEAAPYLRNDARLATWDVLFTRALNEVNEKDGRSQSSTSLSTELGALSRSRATYDSLINEG